MAEELISPAGRWWRPVSSLRIIWLGCARPLSSASSAAYLNTAIARDDGTRRYYRSREVVQGAEEVELSLLIVGEPPGSRTRSLSR